MSKRTIICSYLDWVHISDVELSEDKTISLKAGSSWTRIMSQNKVTYQSETDNPSAGAINNESVNVTAYTNDVSELLNRSENYILRLFDQDEEIIIGSLEYPAIKSYSNNKIRATITFNCQSPL